MSHLDFARPSGVWAREMVPGAQDYYRWDVSQSKLLNGDAGGSWSPKTPIIIGGAGVALSSTGDVIRGGVRTQTGGRLILGQFDIPTLNPRTKSVTYSLLAVKPSVLGTGATYTSPGGNFFQYPPDAIQWKSPPPFATGLVTSSPLLQIPLPKAYVVRRGVKTLDGVLSRVTLTYSVITKPPKVAQFATAPFLNLYSSAGPNAPLGNLPLGPSQILQTGFNLLPWSGIWRAGAAVSAGQYFFPAFDANGPQVSGSYFKATTAGTTNTVREPGFNTTPGSTTADGSVVWTCIGSNGSPLLPGTQVIGGGSTDTWFAGGAPQTVTVDYDVTLQQNAIEPDNDYYVVAITLPKDTTKTAPNNVVPLLLRTLRLDWIGLQSMSWR